MELLRGRAGNVDKAIFNLENVVQENPTYRKGELTLLSKAMKDGYRGFSGWDQNATVRSTLQRSALQALKGLDERENIIQQTELLLARIDEEE